jgi:protocatechuate 3,4-dioxygenase beta subunit
MMGRSPARIAWAGVALAAALLLGQRPAARTPAGNSANDQAGIVTGRVLNASSGEPLRKARVNLRPITPPGGSTTVSAGEGGVFVLNAVTPGKYQLLVDQTGFVQQAYGAPPASNLGTTFDVSPGQTVDDLVIRMVPQGVIAGKVMDDDGDPLEHAQVTLWRYEYPDGDRQLVRQPYGSPGTNDLGEYRFSGLAPGKYILSAMQTLTSAPSDTDFIPTYFPRSPDARGAAEIEVIAGSEVRGADIRVLKSKLFHVRGTVTGSDDGPPPATAGPGDRIGRFEGPQASVALLSMDSAAPSRGGIVHPDGTFEITHVAPGSYTLQANGRGAPQESKVARAAIEVAGKDVEGVTLRLLTPTQASGKVLIDPPDAPAPRFQDVQLLLRGALSRAPIGGYFRIQADGSFRVPSQMWGDVYRLETSGIPDGYYLKTVRMDGREMPDARFDFTSGGPPEAHLELVIAPTSAVLGGTVNDSNGQAVPGVKVTVVPASDSTRRDLFPSQNSDASGNFAFKSLPPGKYRVYAWRSVESNAWMNAQYRAPYESLAGTAELTDSGAVNLTLKLIEGVR